MGEYTYSVFYENLETMNSKDIANWLKKCRNAVEKTDNKEEYLRKVKKFTDEWHIHYEENKNTFYDKPKFKTALLSLAVPSAEVMAVINGVNQSVDVFSFQTANTHYPFIAKIDEILEEEERQDTKEYIRKVFECFNAKNKSRYLYLLDDLIKDNLHKKTAVQIKKLKGKSIKEYKSYDELMKDIENVKNYTTEIEKIDSHRDTKEYILKGYTDLVCRYIKIGYQKRFKEFNISKTIYEQLFKENTREKEFDKKMFVNIGFLLSLPSSLFNKFLSYNGLSVDNSTRKFDEIIDRAFKLGFGRDLTLDLIEYYNNKLDKDFKKMGYIPVPSLTSNKKEKENSPYSEKQEELIDDI